VILKPSLWVQWGVPIIFLVMAAAFLSNAYQNYVQGGLGESWFSAAKGLIALCLVSLSRATYIRVDDSTIFFGPNLPGRRSFPRGEVAVIRATYSPMTRRTLFLRSNGSTLWSTPGFAWGKDGLQSLADYLGVPFEGWRSTPT
jgi:hypothetical protein